MTRHRTPTQINNRVVRSVPPERLLTTAIGAFLVVIVILAWVFFFDGLGELLGQ